MGNRFNFDIAHSRIPINGNSCRPQSGIHPEPILSPILAIGSTLHSIVLDFDQAAAVEYQRLRRGRIRVGSMDLRIAAIAISREATLVSRFLKDFRKVSGLKVEDWTR